MNALLLFAAGERSGQIGQIAETFGVDWPHLISQIISFSIVCLLLYLFAYKPVLRMLSGRRVLIAQGLANSEKIRAELAKTEALRQEVLAQANVQANQFIEDARDAARRLREQETQKAAAAAEQIIAKAREAAVQDHTRMLAQLKREVGHLVVQTTASITGKILTTDDQRRLAEETARELTTQQLN
ncbi:MAG TPA: F0F1 ATP synthase subunit B [Pyrinomonadaceae bacterium]|nr:F0F1 ATP synthase subunit B [Pyrinomonadaceae bacterium]